MCGDLPKPGDPSMPDRFVGGGVADMPEWKQSFFYKYLHLKKRVECMERQVFKEMQVFFDSF